MTPLEWPAGWSAAHLERLAGSPFDTLIVEDPKVQEAAEARGLRCFSQSAGTLKWQAWSEVDWANPGEIVAIGDAMWPALSGRGGPSTSRDADAGPTGAPWLDANGWLALLARARAPGREVWLHAPPPEKLDILRPGSYLLAAAEAFVYGAVRPAWIADQHLEGAWKPLCELTTWLKEHAEWMTWKVPAPLVIVSDYTGPNEYLGSETLLLAARRGLVFEPVECKRLDAKTLAGRRGVLWLDPAPAPKELAEFARGGGLVILRKEAASSLPASKPLTEAHDRFTLRALGNGRVAVASADWDDPWVLAQDAHLLLSRRWDPVRLFNGGSLQFHYTLAPSGDRAMVHLLNYTLSPSWNPVCLAVSNDVRKARIHLPGLPPSDAEIHREGGRLEIHMPQFPVYLSVELELRRNG